MKRHSWIVAGTALGLLMGPAATIAAANTTHSSAGISLRSQSAGDSLPLPLNDIAQRGNLFFAQAEEPEELPRKQRQKRQAAEEEEAAPDGDAPKKPRRDAPAAGGPEKSAERENAPRRERPAKEPTKNTEAPSSGAPAPAKAPEAAPEPRPDRKASTAEEPADAPATSAPATEEPAPRRNRREAPATEDAPAREAPVKEAPAKAAPAAEAPAKPAKEAPAKAEPVTKAPETGAPAKPAKEAPREAPAAGVPAGQAPAPGTPANPPAEVPAPSRAPSPAPSPTAAPEASAPAPEGMAPVLDSQKRGQDRESARRPGKDGAPAKAPTSAPATAAPPPESDAAAQSRTRPTKLEAVTAEEGRKVERRPDRDPEGRDGERPDGVEVLREVGDRLILQFNNQTIVESSDRPRMNRGARDVIYEDLSGGRTRETIVRENGTRVVTIRNRNGDVIRRSRIMADGREFVLVYVDDRDYDRVIDWRDPGDDLPPMRLTIPIREYILEAESVRDADTYYEFFEQPPVEAVERLYSIDEVKRSARIRDKTRRVDLDTITFEFGSASIAESEIGKLEGVAEAMLRLLEQNPAETFLIEGHTDAVGSNVANLALSDQRAEAVAEALTSVFEIPPENLATQGYGEEYLKIDTEEPERENRRVAMRRVTPLVAPVASAR